MTLRHLLLWAIMGPFFLAAAFIMRAIAAIPAARKKIVRDRAVRRR